MNDYTYFCKDASRWEQSTEAAWEVHNTCPLLMQFKVLEITQSGISTNSQAEVWGDHKKPRFGMAYLLLVPAQEAEEERKFGLVAVWVHPHQALLLWLDEVAKKTCLTYQYQGGLALHLCAVMQGLLAHPPLQHLSILVDGAPRSACRCLSHLKVHKLLQFAVK